MKIKAKRFIAILLSTIFITLGLSSNSLAKEIDNTKELNKNMLRQIIVKIYNNSWISFSRKIWRSIQFQEQL